MFSFNIWPWFLCPLAIVLCSISVSQGSSEQCPSMCNGCDVGSFSCQHGGLTHMPKKLPRGITNIILVSHALIDTTLSQSTLSHYGSPNFSINKLVIQNCSIQKIEARAFVSMKKLGTLDLSRNMLTEIVDNTFEGLTLSFLRLDGNSGLKLSRLAFRGMTVRSLSLKNCELDRLEFDTFELISSRLTNLYLSDNQIKTIEPRFNLLLHRLDNIALDNNPLNCTCDLFWLARIFIWKSKYVPLKSSFEGDNVYPTCAGPSFLAGRKMHELPESGSHCEPPQLRSLDIDLMTHAGGQLRCTGAGSPYMRVIWSRPGNAAPLNPTYPVGAVSGVKTVILPIVREADIERYVCLALDHNGNATAEIKISWPPLPKTRPPVQVDLDDGQQRNKKTSKDGDQRSANTWNGDRERERPPSAADTYFFKKQFTLLEMIGAVVGTFTITLAIFLFVYWFWVHTRRKKPQKPPYVTYETAGYSDSQTYDLPHHPPYPSHNTQFLDFKTQRTLFNHV